MWNVLSLHEQGEKGEPGVTIAADGSIISAPRGPQGPKGFKVQECDLLPQILYWVTDADHRMMHLKS